MCYYIYCKSALSSADRVPGYEPVGREFESPRARHKQKTTLLGGFLFITPWGESALLCNLFANGVRKQALSVGACSQERRRSSFCLQKASPRAQICSHPLFKVSLLVCFKITFGKAVFQFAKHKNPRTKIARGFYYLIIHQQLLRFHLRQELHQDRDIHPLLCKPFLQSRHSIRRYQQ